MMIRQSDSGLGQKVAELEQTIADVTTANCQRNRDAGYKQNKLLNREKNASKSSQTFKVPTGKINEVLKTATKQDIQTIREEWAGMMQTMQKSHSAFLEETEPVAASENAFVLKFKYEIHCLMASENHRLRSGFRNALRSRTGKPYEVVYVPEEGWLKVREEFIRNNGLAKQQENAILQMSETARRIPFLCTGSRTGKCGSTCNRSGKDFW